MLKGSQKASNDENEIKAGDTMKESDGYIGMKDVPATQKVPDAFFPQCS